MRLRKGEEVRVKKIRIGGKSWEGIEVVAKAAGMSPYKLATLVLEGQFSEERREDTITMLLETVRAEIRRATNEEC